MGRVARDTTSYELPDGFTDIFRDLDGLRNTFGGPCFVYLNIDTIRAHRGNWAAYVLI